MLNSLKASARVALRSVILAGAAPTPTPTYFLNPVVQFTTSVTAVDVASSTNVLTRKR